MTKESSSCIGLIFTSNPSLNCASRVEFLLYEKFQHNEINEKINFNNRLPPPDIGKGSDYKNAKM